MFSLLPLSVEQMAKLRDKYAIYGTENGRINVAGIQTTKIKTVAQALAAILTP